MRLINPSFEIIPQEEGIKGIYKQIEKGGKVCYQSSHTITEDSAEKFVNDVLIKNNHGRPLEHGTVYLDFTNPPKNVMSSEYAYIKYAESPYSKMKDVPLKNGYVTTNMRVLVENNWLSDLKYQCEPTEYHEKRITVRVICDRQIQTEIKTHTTLSSTFESTRFCNYSKDKYGNELTFIIPSNLNLDEGTYNSENTDNLSEDKHLFVRSLIKSEYEYLTLINVYNWKPQFAAKVLPNDLKSEGYITGFISDWKHFFDMRCAENAHPDIQKLAKGIKKEFIKLGYI